MSVELQEFLNVAARMRESLAKAKNTTQIERPRSISIDDDVLVIPETSEPAGGREWLHDELHKHTLVHTTSLPFEDLYNTVLSLLVSDAGPEEIQSQLADVLGFEAFDLIIQLIQRRAEIKHDDPNGIVSEESHSQGPFLTDEARARHVRETQRKLAEKASRLVMGQVDPRYPHVYRAHDAGSTLNAFGSRYTLPMGTTRTQHETHEEVIIPHSKVRAPVRQSDLVQIKDLDELCRGTFSKYKTLNRMQSLVYPVGYETSENMLVCAPTGAGKTDVALLTMLQTIKAHSVYDPETQSFDVNYDDFKIVYVAPLKALAAEIVEKMGTRLAWLGINVRELTGDMQLTRTEIAATQVIVTTPEKWDVVSRKSGGGDSLVSKVKLLVIDEVHLLHEERGAVIESLVARTLRQVESTQSLIRIVGLSATLPNFLDVAEFLRVNTQQGLFYFDSSFRPVPLEQQFVGVRGKAGSRQAAQNIDHVTYDKIVDMLNEGHQVMVFVHSRKDTVKSARTFMGMARENGDERLFDASGSPGYTQYERDMSKWKNKDMRELFQAGFGCHHAGMLRSERNMTERLFMSGAIKVLCCTATLAWGVNLPAAVVIIKGTQVYDAKHGGFVNLGISDVIQIFGRAGRPQFEKYGTGILCTTMDTLDHYLALITQQHPIESRLQAKIPDNLNAEISLGTVTNVDEGVQWLGYTYLFVRMRKNPLSYGINWSDVSDDPLLGQRRRELIVAAARRLHSLQMIIYDDKTDSFIAKDTGRIASDFYLLNASVEVFNTLLNPVGTEADVLAMISMSGEFDGIKAREEEAKELEHLRDDVSPCQIASGVDTPEGKTNVLIQAFISKAVIQDSALSSDSMYVAQNTARISRALFLMCVNRRWGRLARIVLSLCKSLEKRLWSYEHPLAQFELPQTVLRNLEAKKPAISDLKDMETREIGELVHNTRIGPTIAKYVDRFPLVEIDEAEIKPITNKVMRVHLELTPDFKWDLKYHHKAQIFWVWVEEDSEKQELLHVEKLVLYKPSGDPAPHVLDFTLPVQEPLPQQLVVRVTSDTWLGAETSVAVSFQHLIRPETIPIQTKLLKLQPLPVSALDNPEVEQYYYSRFQYFNPMQTMTFNTLYHRKTSVLLGSPTGSGKTIACEIAMWAAFRDNPGSKIVYIAPMKALVKERVGDWKRGICRHLGKRLVELTGDTNPDADSIRKADIIITTPEKFDGISRNWQSRKFVQQVSLIVMDEVHLLASDRGAILEMIVSRMNFVTQKTKQPVRLLGMSTAVANAIDLASWLGVEGNSGLFNFSQSVRPVPLEMYIDGFPDNLGFCPLMKTMNKPAFLAIKRHAPSKPALVFVASRRQTRLTAEDFIHLCGMEENPRRFLHMDENELAQVTSRVRDDTLRLSLQFGIALHHAGLVDSDRKISHELFANGKVQILVATSTLAWGVNLPAYLVVIKGTQFFDAKIDNYRDMDLTDVLQMMGRAGRPAYDTRGVAVVFTKESTKSFYKYFLNSGFPVESSLHKFLDDHLGAELSAGTIKSKQQALEFLTWTFLYRRIHNNPSYYNIEGTDPHHINKWATELIDQTVDNLRQSGCVNAFEDGRLEPTRFLRISSYYYISHKTIRYFLATIRPKLTIKDALLVLTKVTEYDELAIRHNEDIVNEELSQNLRFHGEDVGLRMVDPHVKAFLLVQAHMTHIDLPIEDYIQDTVAVLDQSLRILQAAVDTAAELGFLDACLQLIQLMQCIKQACWDDDDPVTCLPGLSLKKRRSLDEKSAKGYRPMTLKDVAASPDEAAAQLRISKRHQAEFKRVAGQLPVLGISVASSDPITLRIEKLTSRPKNVYAPRFHKPQTETWFIIVANGNELISLQRFSPASRPGEQTVSLKGKGDRVLVVNDAMDISYELSL